MRRAMVGESRRGRFPRLSRQPAPGTALAVLFVALLMTDEAAAEAVVLMPHHGDEGLELPREQATRVLHNELESQGLKVISHEKAREAATGQPGDECAQINCARTLIRAAGADVAAAVAVWDDGEGAPAKVFVTLMDSRGARYPGESEVELGDLPRATRAALLDARALQLLGPGPWLRVGGEPEGAKVLIDGTLVGSVPYRIAIKPGRHVLEVKQEGYRPHLQNVDVPPNDTKQVGVEVSLEPRAGGDIAGALDSSDYALRSDDAGGSAAADYIIGGVLAAGGVGLLAYGLLTLDEEGACDETDPSEPRCIRVTKPALSTWVALGGGAASLGLSAFFLFATPLADPATGTAGLNVHAAF